MCSCGIACLMASRTVRPGSAESARPEMTRLPVVVADNRRPPGCVVRSKDLPVLQAKARDRKSTRLNSSHSQISYAVFCLKKKKKKISREKENMKIKNYEWS